MAFSLPQIESNAQFSPLPCRDIEQGHQEKMDIVNLYDEGPESSWDYVAATVRLVVIGILLFVYAIYVKQLEEHSDPIQPKFFVNSLRVSSIDISDGELSASWDVHLTLVNVMNDTNIRIGKMEAALMYEENEILAVATPVEPYDLFKSEGSLMEAREEKSIYFKFSTMGWKKEQSILDDTVIQDIAEDWKRGMIRFSMQIKMKGNLEFDEWLVPFVMYPSCNNLDVQFTTTSALEVAGNLVDGEVRVCSSVIKYGYVRSA